MDIKPPCDASPGLITKPPEQTAEHRRGATRVIHDLTVAANAARGITDFPLSHPSRCQTQPESFHRLPSTPSSVASRSFHCSEGTEILLWCWTQTLFWPNNMLWLNILVTIEINNYFFCLVQRSGHTRSKERWFLRMLWSETDGKWGVSLHRMKESNRSDPQSQTPLHLWYTDPSMIVNIFMIL